jgi:hypothetical protein
MKGNFHVRFLGECGQGNLSALTRLNPTQSDQPFCLLNLPSARALKEERNYGPLTVNNPRVILSILRTDRKETVKFVGILALQVRVSPTQSNLVQPNPTTPPPPGKETVKFLAIFDHAPIRNTGPTQPASLNPYIQ